MLIFFSISQTFKPTIFTMSAPFESTSLSHELLAVQHGGVPKNPCTRHPRLNRGRGGPGRSSERPRALCPGDLALWPCLPVTCGPHRKRCATKRGPPCKQGATHRSPHGSQRFIVWHTVRIDSSCVAGILEIPCRIRGWGATTDSASLIPFFSCLW